MTCVADNNYYLLFIQHFQHPPLLYYNISQLYFTHIFSKQYSTVFSSDQRNNNYKRSSVSRSGIPRKIFPCWIGTPAICSISETDPLENHPSKHEHLIHSPRVSRHGSPSNHGVHVLDLGAWNDRTSLPRLLIHTVEHVDLDVLEGPDWIAGCPRHPVPKRTAGQRKEMSFVEDVLAEEEVCRVLLVEPDVNKPSIDIIILVEPP